MIEKIIAEIHRLKNDLDGYSALEAMDYIESYINALSRPSLPSNLDDAANEEADELLADMKIDGDMIYLPTAKVLMIALARFGAEWMAGQFERIEGQLVDWHETQGVDYCCGIKTDESFEVPEGFYIKKK